MLVTRSTLFPKPSLKTKGACTHTLSFILTPIFITQNTQSRAVGPHIKNRSWNSFSFFNLMMKRFPRQFSFPFFFGMNHSPPPSLPLHSSFMYRVCVFCFFFKQKVLSECAYFIDIFISVTNNIMLTSALPKGNGIKCLSLFSVAEEVVLDFQTLTLSLFLTLFYLFSRQQFSLFYCHILYWINSGGSLCIHPLSHLFT